MADSKNEPRPVRRLTVKNFSVIKEAELEFGKITVLIGPQSSGKSLLCKLAYFFQQIVIEQGEISIRAVESFTAYRERLIREFLRWFSVADIEYAPCEILYSDGEYWVNFSHKRISAVGTSLNFEVSEGIKASYNSNRRRLQYEKSHPHGVRDIKSYADAIREGFEKLRSTSTPDIYSYIPSTRSFFVTVEKAILASANRADPISVRFSQDFNYGFETSIPKAGLAHPLTKWINSESERILQGKIVAEGGDFSFLTTDRRALPLSVLSSGTQELLPLVTCLREYVAASVATAGILNLPKALHKRLFFLEEPESNVFPSTQYELVRIVARLANEPALDANWVITTHSPYILSSFNNLIEAGQAARSHPELQDQVAKIIPEQYWVREGDFKAYSIQDGKLESILNESGLVEGNYLDQVSETISDEFDRLIKLEYDHAKAS